MYTKTRKVKYQSCVTGEDWKQVCFQKTCNRAPDEKRRIIPTASKASLTMSRLTRT